MGTYINKGNEGFLRALNEEYVDKTGMIEIINKTLNTENCCTCVTRSRGFGKSVALNMLCAYYDKSCNSRSIFDGLKASSCATFEAHLNKYPTILLNITDFIMRYYHDAELVKYIQRDLKADILSEFPEVSEKENDDLMEVLIRIHQHTQEKFIMLIDEWDAICREFDKDSSVMEEYLNLMRRLFKGSNSADVFAGVYITGILPIKKYNSQSVLNNFREYSVVQPGRLATYFGFVPSEIETLHNEEGLDLMELKKWFGGYQIGSESSVYNPNSVMLTLTRGRSHFWDRPCAYDSLSNYIEMNFEGLKDDIISMLAGEHCSVDTTGFLNDMHDVRSKDDVLTMLIHLGYLSYDEEEGECHIPNNGVRMEIVNAVKSRQWKVAKALENSERLLSATFSGDADAVAYGINLAHDENTSILSYNNENSLACVLSIAYYAAKDNYIIHRELATGKGFADLVLIPRHNIDSPAIILELKLDKDADTGIEQIKRKQYPSKIAEHTGTLLLLVGIYYDKTSKTHTCKIEKMTRYIYKPTLSGFHNEKGKLTFRTVSDIVYRTEEDVYIWEDELNYMEWTLLLEELRNKKKYIIKRFPLTTTTYQSTELQTFVCKIFGTNTKHTAPPTREKGIIPLSFIEYVTYTGYSHVHNSDGGYEEYEQCSYIHIISDKNLTNILSDNEKILIFNLFEAWEQLQEDYCALGWDFDFEREDIKKGRIKENQRTFFKIIVKKLNEYCEQSKIGHSFVLEQLFYNINIESIYELGSLVNYAVDLKKDMLWLIEEEWKKKGNPYGPYKLSIPHGYKMCEWEYPTWLI